MSRLLTLIFSHLPTFEATNRRNAYGVYLSLEQELLDQ